MATRTSTTASPLLDRVKNNLPSLTLLLIGFVVGVLWFGALRLLLHSSEETHYHSNFAVYIDGTREEFKNFTYYEEVAACTTAFADNPKGRAHMHGNVNDVIHVHDQAVTYADFFENLDWSIGPDFVRTDQGLIQNNDEKQWVFILNGEKVARVDNKVIGNEDKLLVSYGAADTDFTAQYNGIADTAEEVNSKADPASCSGLNGSHDNSFPTRLRNAFNFTE